MRILKHESRIGRRAAAGRIAALAFTLTLLVSGAAAQSDSDPARLFTAAQDAHERGQLQEAVALYRSAIEAFPKFPEAEFQLGNAYRQLGQLEQAEECYRRALDIRRNWTLPMVSLASLRAAKGDLTEAENLVQDAIGLGGENSAAYSVLADVLLKRNASSEELRSALQSIRELTARPRTQASLHVSQASLEQRLGDAKAASASIEAALRIEPNNIDAISVSVELALASRDTDTAVAQASRLLLLTPQSDSAKLLAARAHASAGDLDKSLVQLDSMKRSTPDSEALRRDLAVASTKDPLELERSLSANPNDMGVIGRLCILLRTSIPAKAVDYCRRALESDPSNVTFATRYAAALVQAQKFQEAGGLLLRLKDAAPDNYTVRAYLATVYYQMKRWNEAKSEYKWLQERQPRNAMTYYMLGIVHDRLEEYLGALDQYQQFLALADPKTHQLEIEKVNLRLPSLKNQIREKKGR